MQVDFEKEDLQALRCVIDLAECEQCGNNDRCNEEDRKICMEFLEQMEEVWQDEQYSLH